jgi:hypothetical protein
MFSMKVMWFIDHRDILQCPSLQSTDASLQLWNQCSVVFFEWCLKFCAPPPLALPYDLREAIPRHNQFYVSFLGSFGSKILRSSLSGCTHKSCDTHSDCNISLHKPPSNCRSTHQHIFTLSTIWPWEYKSSPFWPQIIRIQNNTVSESINKHYHCQNGILILTVNPFQRNSVKRGWISTNFSLFWVHWLSSWSP